MSLFLTEEEKAAFAVFRKSVTTGQDLFWALAQRVEKRTASPGLHGHEEESNWWFCAAEYLTDAAMLQALKPSELIEAWLRDVTLSLARRPEDDWIGPSFRDHATRPARGHLETAHLSWAVAVALDLAPGAFTDSEHREIRELLKKRAIPMCRRWLDANRHMANWRCVLGAGVAVAAAVLDDKDEMDLAIKDYQLHAQAFQSDGSYGESLQYANYAAYTLMLSREALIRRNPDLEADLPADPWARLPNWQAASLFYRKPLSGWGASPRARSANFNDSGALFRPSAELLLHIAKRLKASFPKEAGLARWLFDTLYAPDLAQGPHDRASFGFINDFGFLSVSLLPGAADACGPDESGLPTLAAFSCGDVFARDSWDGRTILAVHGGGDPLRGPGHLHGDLNSFILVHNQERLLVDPGHSCYRNLMRQLDRSTATHNTCTFLPSAEDGLGLQEDKGSGCVLDQACSARVFFDPATQTPESPADRGAKRLLAEQHGDVSVIGSEASALYGDPIQDFSRILILCGSHALFVVDRIVASRPVTTRWHWLLNNRDNELQLKVVPPDRAVARRGNAGLKLFHLNDATIGEPENAYVHDAYHPLPARRGEGLPGSGKLLTWRERMPATSRTAVHAIAIDGYGPIASWHLKSEDDNPFLESPGGGARWSIKVSDDARQIEIMESVARLAWTVTGGIKWTLEPKD